MRGRHAEHYLALAELAYTERFDPGRAWARRLEAEHDNLRAALDYLQVRDPARYLQLAGALGWFWGTGRVRGGSTKARRRARLARRGRTAHGTGADAPRIHRGGTRGVRGRAESTGAGGRALARPRGRGAVGRDPRRAGLGSVPGGREPRALELFDQNLEDARNLGDEALVTNALAGVCQLLVATGQFERAEPLARELHDDHFLADCAMHRRDYALRRAVPAERSRNRLTTGTMSKQTTEILGLAMTAAGLGRDEDALRLEGAVEAQWEELGVVARPRVLETWRERDLGAARASLGEPRAAALRRRAGDEVGPGRRARAGQDAERLELHHRPECCAGSIPAASGRPAGLAAHLTHGGPYTTRVVSWGHSVHEGCVPDGAQACTSELFCNPSPWKCPGERG